MILNHHTINATSAGGAVPNCLYLTYFDGLDTQNKIDYPKIGNPNSVTISNQVAIINRNYLGFNTPFISNGGNESYINFNIDLNLDDIGLFSVEWIDFYDTAYSSSAGADAGLRIISNSKAIGPGSSITNFPTLETNGSETLYNNYWYDRSWSSTSSYTGIWIYLRNPSLYTINNYNHIAVVYDLYERKYYTFANGLLACVGDFSSVTLNNTMATAWCYWHSTWQAYRTQFCVFKGDKSQNNRTTYPVPIKPYWNYSPVA